MAVLTADCLRDHPRLTFTTTSKFPRLVLLTYNHDSDPTSFPSVVQGNQLIQSHEQQTMDLTLESKACSACARAKRKCGRQIPRCGRCQSRDIPCEYTHVKSSLPFPPDHEVEMGLHRRAQTTFFRVVPSLPSQADFLRTQSLDNNTLLKLSVNGDAMHIETPFLTTSASLFPALWTTQTQRLRFSAPPLR